MRLLGKAALQFAQTTGLFETAFVFVGRCFWLPIWTVLASLLGIVVPILCKYLDQFDRERRFTVGYDVTAVRISG